MVIIKISMVVYICNPATPEKGRRITVRLSQKTKQKTRELSKVDMLIYPFLKLLKGLTQNI
jgi:hypothetical protein